MSFLTMCNILGTSTYFKVNRVSIMIHLLISCVILVKVLKTWAPVSSSIKWEKTFFPPKRNKWDNRTARALWNSRVPFLGERDHWGWLPSVPRIQCPAHGGIKSIFLCMLSEWLCPSPSSRSEPRNISWAKLTQHVKHLSIMHLAPSPGSCRNSSAYPQPPLNSAPTLKAIQDPASLCYYVKCGQWQTHGAKEKVISNNRVF